MPQPLRPTVKRDLSVFSAMSWELGYTKYLKNTLGYWFDIFLHYDGEKVNFYHRLSDFEHFKKVITPKLSGNHNLFAGLNKKFQKNVEKLKQQLIDIDIKEIEKISNLIGEIMSFYIFVVSDSFVEQNPEAWKSRNMSEGILYDADIKIEENVGKLLKKLKIPTKPKHFLSPIEIYKLAFGKKIDLVNVKNREHGYTIFRNKIITSKTFEQICSELKIQNPEIEKTEFRKELTGKIAYGGKVTGTVKIINSIKDLKKIKKGDVLVSIMTNVNYLPAIKKVVGIITDEGGITCHAAIIAREFKIPTVTGTKIATKVFKDGDLVEMNACPNADSRRACPNAKGERANIGIIKLLK